MAPDALKPWEPRPCGGPRDRRSRDRDRIPACKPKAEVLRQARFIARAPPAEPPQSQVVRSLCGKAGASQRLPGRIPPACPRECPRSLALSQRNASLRDIEGNAVALVLTSHSIKRVSNDWKCKRSPGSENPSIDGLSHLRSLWNRASSNIGPPCRGSADSRQPGGVPAYRPKQW